MATNAPASRKTHITRIFGTNKKGERLDYMWADVERMGVIKSVHQVPPDLQWQGLQRKLLWADDPYGDDYAPDGIPSRIVETVKLCDVQSQDNPDDPSEWIPIKVVKAVKSFDAAGLDVNGGGAMDRFIASLTSAELGMSREVMVRKVVHCDTNYDAVVQSALDANSSLREFVIPASDYVKDVSTKDTNQYVEHEIILHLKDDGNDGDISGQHGQTRLLNEYLVDESEKAEGKVVGAFGVNPPYRLDPWQNIVNVKFSTLYLIVGVSGGNNSASAGPFGEAPGVGKPSISCRATNLNDKRIKLLDSDGDDGALNTYLNCFLWGGGRTAQAAYTAAHDGSGGGGGTGQFPPEGGPGGACNLTPAQEASGFLATPSDFVQSTLTARRYLFEVSAGSDLVSINIAGLEEHFDNGPTGGGTYNTISVDGSATIQLWVYSTVRKRVSKLTDLIDSSGDGKPRPTQDDFYTAGVTADAQGSFTVSIKLDNDKSHAQTDNYGNKFQPFKVTLDPGLDGIDQIPGQPPPRLPR